MCGFSSPNRKGVDGSHQSKVFAKFKVQSEGLPDEFVLVHHHHHCLLAVEFMVERRARELFLDSLSSSSETPLVFEN